MKQMQVDVSTTTGDEPKANFPRMNWVFWRVYMPKMQRNEEEEEEESVLSMKIDLQLAAAFCCLQQREHRVCVSVRACVCASNFSSLIYFSGARPGR